MSNGYGVNLTDSMIAEINKLPDVLVTLPYLSKEKFSAVLRLILSPILIAATLVHGSQFYSSSLTPLIDQIIMGAASVAFLFMFLGFFRVQKYYSPKIIFTDEGISVSGVMTEWRAVDHAEVLSEPRPEDKASIVLYLGDERQLPLRINKHEIRMKVSEVIRRHVTNIAFKD